MILSIFKNNNDHSGRVARFSKCLTFHFFAQRGYSLPIEYYCYELVQSFWVHCLFSGQFNTEDYCTFTDDSQLEDQQVAPVISLQPNLKTVETCCHPFHSDQTNT